MGSILGGRFLFLLLLFIFQLQYRLMKTYKRYKNSGIEWISEILVEHLWPFFATRIPSLNLLSGSFFYCPSITPNRVE
jgi:hypothetical protein